MIDFDAKFAGLKREAQAAAFTNGHAPVGDDEARIAAAVAEAQRLATLGFGVVEAYPPKGDGSNSDGKRPVGDDWQKRATRSPRTIETIIRRQDGPIRGHPLAR